MRIQGGKVCKRLRTVLPGTQGYGSLCCCPGFNRPVPTVLCPAPAPMLRSSSFTPLQHKFSILPAAPSLPPLPRAPHSAFTLQTTGTEGVPGGPAPCRCPAARAPRGRPARFSPPGARGWGRAGPGRQMAQRDSSWEPQPAGRAPRQRRPLCARPRQVPEAHEAS